MITLKNRNLSPAAQQFMNCARATIKLAASKIPTKFRSVSTAKTIGLISPLRRADE
jgi:hypothetical protein